ncbi:UNKNOWN [Stylonychia lemnae]|uniref:Transmembrane protein n=1 Tax=Stylonychia lemnae TaxID=5949 RepID=A0A078ABG1_STYLE|nr:UNKNOWN [Stylonychia lemnae]|eukprot:CDW78907.1 UNKNOWN [Stylonychia lemnae]
MFTHHSIFFIAVFGVFFLHSVIAIEPSDQEPVKLYYFPMTPQREQGLNISIDLNLIDTSKFNYSSTTGLKLEFHFHNKTFIIDTDSTFKFSKNDAFNISTQNRTVNDETYLDILMMRNDNTLNDTFLNIQVYDIKRNPKDNFQEIYLYSVYDLSNEYETLLFTSYGYITYQFPLNKINEVEIFYQEDKQFIKYLWFNMSLENQYQNPQNLGNKSYSMFVKLQQQLNYTQPIRTIPLQNISIMISNENTTYYEFMKMKLSNETYEIHDQTILEISNVQRMPLNKFIPIKITFEEPYVNQIDSIYVEMAESSSEIILEGANYQVQRQKDINTEGIPKHPDYQVETTVNVGLIWLLAIVTSHTIEGLFLAIFCLRHKILHKLQVLRFFIFSRYLQNVQTPPSKLQVRMTDKSDLSVSNQDQTQQNQAKSSKKLSFANIQLQNTPQFRLDPNQSFNNNEMSFASSGKTSLVEPAQNSKSRISSKKESRISIKNIVKRFSKFVHEKIQIEDDKKEYDQYQDSERMNYNEIIDSRRSETPQINAQENNDHPGPPESDSIDNTMNGDQFNSFDVCIVDKTQNNTNQKSSLVYAIQECDDEDDFENKSKGSISKKYSQGSDNSKLSIKQSIVSKAQNVAESTKSETAKRIKFSINQAKTSVKNEIFKIDDEEPDEQNLNRESEFRQKDFTLNPEDLNLQIDEKQD